VWILNLNFSSIAMNKKIVPVIAVSVLISLIGVFLYFHYGRTLTDRMEHAVGRIVSACADVAYKPSCYDKEIPKFLGKFSMEEVFAITKKVQTRDASYSYCHVLGHAVSAYETKKDPSTWQEVITRCPSGVCSNGCVHGAFQERFRTDVLTSEQIQGVAPDLRSVCEPREGWNPTGMEQATCYHALGHLLMYITGADIPQSLILCDDFAAQRPGSSYDFHQICYDGAFMQIFQPLEPEDIALVKGKQPTRETVSTFCSQYGGEQHASCVGESWPLFFNELTQNPQFVTAFCGTVEEKFKERCYNGVFYILVVQFRFNLDQMYAYCTRLSDPLSGRCFANTASRLIETDWENINNAVGWCNRAERVEDKEACFSELVVYASYNFHKDSGEFRALCTGLEDPWKERCFGSSMPRDLKPVSE
jgi:hypothetical protein